MSQQNFDIEPFEMEPPATHGGPSPWQFIQDRLYGRWRYAIPLAIVMAVVGSAVGFLIAPAKFVATGFVEVQPTVQRVLSDTPEVIPAYDAYVETQLQVIQLDDVLDRALNGPKYTEESKGIRLKDTFGSIGALRSSLSVAREKRGTFIRVSVESDEPEPTYWMVRAILESYFDQVAPATSYQNRKAAVERLKELEELDLARLEDQRRGTTRIATNRYAAFSDAVLRSMSEFHWQELSELAIRLNERGIPFSLAEFLVNSGRQIGERGDSNTATASPESGDESQAVDEDGGHETVVDIEPTRAELEEFDPELRRYRSILIAEEAQLQQLRESLGEENLSFKRQQNRVAAAMQNLEMLRKTAIQQWRVARIGEQEALGGDGGASTPDSIAQDILSEATEIGNEIKLIDNEIQVRDEIDQQISRIELNLVGIRATLNELTYNRDTYLEGRTRIHNPSSIPSAPQKTKKRQMAIAGFLGGLCLPFGLFILIGHVDRRAFGASQVHGDLSAYECLGVMPDLSHLESSADTRNLTASCVHRLRNRLALGRGNNAHGVFAVSSPFQGDGKTSLAFALAWSYAGSGYRTVLVDTDFVGQTLTEQVDKLNQPGFRDLLNGRRPNGEVRKLMDNGFLSVIGVGSDASPVGPESVTRENVKAFLHHLREQYEVAILDTGPLLGSVEALPIVSAVDGVVLTLRRGRSRRRLDECAREINAVGSKLLGVVLNCANESECRRYTSSSLTSARNGGRSASEQSDSAPTIKRPAAVISLLGADRDGHPDGKDAQS